MSEVHKDHIFSLYDKSMYYSVCSNCHVTYMLKIYIPFSKDIYITYGVWGVDLDC